MTLSGLCMLGRKIFCIFLDIIFLTVKLHVLFSELQMKKQEFLLLGNL